MIIMITHAILILASILVFLGVEEGLPMSHWHGLSVFRSHFRGLICLMVCFSALFLLFLVSLVREVFIDFDLTSPKSMSRMTILKPRGSKKTTKEIQRHLTWIHHALYHG